MIDDQNIQKQKPLEIAVFAHLALCLLQKRRGKSVAFCLTLNMIVGDDRKTATGAFQTTATPAVVVLW